MPNIYISGPMTGYVDYNYPEFMAMEQKLISEGKFEKENIRNPARIDDAEPIKYTHSREHYMRKSIEMLLECTHVVTLPQWDRSAGARLEVAIAKELGMTVIHHTRVIVDADGFDSIMTTIPGYFSSLGFTVNTDRSLKTNEFWYEIWNDHCRVQIDQGVPLEVVLGDLYAAKEGKQGRASEHIYKISAPQNEFNIFLDALPERTDTYKHCG